VKRRAIGRDAFAPRPKPGRLDFLFDERSGAEAPPAVAEPAPIAAAAEARPATEPAPWEAPPPPPWRGDAGEPEAFVSAGIRLEGAPGARLALTVAFPLGPLRAIAEAAAIIFYGIVARLVSTA
jgi:hypothetical protein